MTKNHIECIPFTCKVSSTLNKNSKTFGKQFMFDGNDETCWNSDQGQIQWILMSFEKPKTFSKIGIQFQGGFAAEECILELLNDGSATDSEILVFENNNSFQNITLSRCYCANTIKLIFKKCFDSFSRIIIYHLQLE